MSVGFSREKPNNFLEGHTNNVKSIEISNDSKFIVSSSDDCPSVES